MIKFEYDGISSDTKGVIITRIEQNDTVISRSPVLGEKNFYRSRENHFGMMYNDNLSFTVHMIKNLCETPDPTPSLLGNVLIYPKMPKLENKTVIFEFDNPYLDTQGILTSPEHTDYFTSGEIRDITSWLTSTNYPRLLKFIDNPYYYEQVEFFAVITDITTEHTDKPYEIIFTVVCDSPFGYAPETKLSLTSISTLPTPLKVVNYSDCHENYVYPLIKVHPTSHGELTIKNVTDNGQLKISMLKNADFYIDCRNLKIYDVVGDILSFKDLGVSDVDMIYFPRLCYGQNTLEFTGNAEITMTYREQRKVGVFA